MLDRFNRFVKEITSLYRTVQKIKLLEMDEFGLKGMHVMCLHYLYNHPDGLTAVQLCALCDEDKAAISRAISTLEEKGLVTQSQTGRQKKYRSLIFLTETGKEVALSESLKIKNAIDAGGEGLCDEERETLYSCLERISENLKRYLEEKDAQNK